MKTQEQKSFQTYLIISSFLHLIFIGVFIFGIPSFKKMPEEQDVVIFEMVDVADLVNIKNQNIETTKDIEIKESQKVKKSTTEVAPVEEEKPKEEVKEEPKLPEKEPEIVPEKKEEVKIPEKVEKKEEVTPPKKEEEKPKPVKIVEKPKKPVKKPVKKEEDVMDSILKNLEKESDGQAIKSPNRNVMSQSDEGKFAKGDYDEDSPLSVTEKLLIKQQIEKNWQPPVGAASLENVQVILHLKVLEDGTITDVRIKDILCPAGAGQTCDLVAQTAARAAKKASPLQNLRPERYDIWREFDLRFDPSNIMKL